MKRIRKKIQPSSITKYFKRIVIALFSIIFVIFAVKLCFITIHSFGGIADLKKQNLALSADLANTREYLLDACREDNVIRDYLFLAKKDCGKYFPELVEQNAQNDSFVAQFLSVFDTYFKERDDAFLKTLAIMSIEQAGVEEKERQAARDEYTRFLQDENLRLYLTDFGYSLEGFGNQGIRLKNGDMPVGELYWDETMGTGMINLLQEKQIFPLPALASAIALAKEEQDDQEPLDILAQIENGVPDSVPREGVLLLGKNGGNIDTIIFASVDHLRKKITLISIPRDLWVDAQKINALYIRSGMDVFRTKIEEILQQKIKHYALVDMSVFPAVVDQLGGVAYRFDAPLIDPTYRTIDDGQEGTLYFAAGTHQLSGIQALRVVRTRNTSSDFERAKRQQGLLAALREKVKNKGNLKSVLAIAPVIIRNLKTDFTPVSAAELFWQSREYKISFGNVMSTKNIFVADKFDLGDGRKTYILKPRNDDWQLIPKFVWSALTS